MSPSTRAGVQRSGVLRTGHDHVGPSKPAWNLHLFIRNRPQLDRGVVRREIGGFAFGSLERRSMRHGRLRASRDAKQLLPLHDEMHDPDDEPGQQQRQPVESVPGSTPNAHEQTRHAGRQFIEQERPRHLWRAVRRRPAKHQHPLVFHCQQRESLRHAGQRREDRADSRMLQFRHDAGRARLPAVVEPVIAVPAAAAACAHLHEPRPHVTRRPSNRHGVRQRVDSLWNPLVSGQRAGAFVCGGADRPPEPPGAEGTDRGAFRAPPNRP